MKEKFDLLSIKNIKEMDESNLIEFGGHSTNHYKLQLLDLDIAKKEILENKNYLENLLKKDLISFSYPYGEFSAELKDFIKNDTNFKFGITTDYSGFCISDDLFAIRRIVIMINITNFGFKRKIKGNYIFRRIKREKIIKNKSLFL